MKAISCPLLYVLCAGLLDSSLAKVKYHTVRMFQSVDLDSYLPCASKWKRGDRVTKSAFNVTSDDAGSYLCDENEVVLIITEGPYLRSRPVSFMASETVNLSCYMSFWFNDCKMKCMLSLMEEDRPLKEQREREAAPIIRNRMRVTHVQTVPSDTTGYYCVWLAHVGRRPNFHSIRMVAERFGRIYAPVTKPWLSNQIVEAGTSVTCHANGNPVPKFVWYCETSGWLSEEEEVVFHVPGNYSCVCAAWNTLAGLTRSGIWTGVLQVVPTKEAVNEKIGGTGKIMGTALSLKCLGLTFVHFFLVLWISGELYPDNCHPVI